MPILPEPGRAGATGSAAAWIAADTVFHANVVRAVGNAYLTALYEGVHTAVLSQEHELWVRTETRTFDLLRARERTARVTKAAAGDSRRPPCSYRRFRRHPCGFSPCRTMQISAWSGPWFSPYAAALGQGTT